MKETENQSIQGGPTSETRNEPSIQLVSDLDGSQETTQTNDNQGEDLLDRFSFLICYLIALLTLNLIVGSIVMKVRLNREEQFPMVFYSFILFSINISMLK